MNLSGNERAVLEGVAAELSKTGRIEAGDALRKALFLAGYAAPEQRRKLGGAR